MTSTGKAARVAALAAAGLGTALAAREAVRRLRESDLREQVVLITGGSRSLGFLLAREFTRQGCRIAICARNEQELERARRELEQEGADAIAVRCDISSADQVERMVDEVTGHFGRVDILVNNAGIIQVGPIQAMVLKDFEDAMDVMFWGVLYPTLAVLPQMLARHGGRIVNITSIGGKVSVPHLLPYNAAKFAAVGLSEGLRAELAREGISVATVVPGLMRTGSHLNAIFKGRQEQEYVWFSLGASLPLISMDAERAARQIVQATKRGEAERILSLPANLLARFHGLFPGLTVELLGLANRILLPPPDGAGQGRAGGEEVRERLHSPLLDNLTRWGLIAAQRFQHAGPGPSQEPIQARRSYARRSR